MIEFLSFLLIIGCFVFISILAQIRKVPHGTVYIIDRNTHYHKTVTHGFFRLNPLTDRITTEISIKPKTKLYQNFYETEDGNVCFVSLSITYSAENVDDVLYNLSATRRSIDDVIQGSVYHAVLSLKRSEINNESLTREFERNINSQVLGLCINVHHFAFNHIDKNTYSTRNVTAFKPHVSQSLNSDKGPFTFNN